MISIKDRIQSQKVVSITSSLKRVIEKVGLSYQDLNKEEIDFCQDLGFKIDSLTRGIERACALHPGIRGVSVSSQKLIMATEQLQLEQTHRQTHTVSFTVSLVRLRLEV